MAKVKDKKSDPTARELRALPVEDLQKKLAEEQELLMRARFSHAMATLEDTAELKTKRRLIARIATILNEKAERV